MKPEPESGLRSTVTESDTDVLISAELGPGIGRSDISLELIDPHALRISCECHDGGPPPQEHRTMTRAIVLPKEVTGEGALAFFRDGVLEVRLKKAAGRSGRRIPVG